ncbi:MAG TPA: hypothetical protein ENG95_05730 [Nitrospirae bacterium]|nr:hypothetical protein [Nitrospirota bacterium]
MQVSRGVHKTVMADVMRIVDQYEIPVEEKDIELTQDNKRYNIKTSWSVTVDFFTVHQETFTFSVDTSKPD